MKRGALYENAFLWYNLYEVTVYGLFLYDFLW